ncbi:MAG: tetraacyldisaccharide 4'-kinase [Azospirillum sp.]|nr:tetraacyldisaccharide 4'-kinase [Azospirillum sp.]
MKAPDFWYRPPSLAAAALGPAAWLFGLAGAWRRAGTTPWRAAIPVVCIGNLVAGGQGKTPVALAVAEAVARHRAGSGRPVHFLSRGYGGREAGPLRVDAQRHDAAAVGDEPLLLAARAPTWVSADRVAGARAAAAAGAGLVIMDDGFQNPGLAKALSLIVVDGATGFGNGRLIPAGPLREPVAAGLARADAVVVLGADRTGVEAGLPVALPVLHARLEPEPASAAALNGRRVLAFAGIGRPAKFFESCAELGAEVVGTAAFPDHHPYRLDQIMALAERARGQAAVLVTTAKDALRLPEAVRTMVDVLAVRVVWHRPERLDLLLDRVLDPCHGQ